MSKKIFRRDVLKGAGAACVAAMLPRGVNAFSAGATVAGQDAEVQIASVSARTVRITVLSVKEGKRASVPENGSLVRSTWGAPAAKWRGESRDQAVKCGELTVKVSAAPFAFTIGSPDGDAIQQLTLDADSGIVSFVAGDAPLLGFGEGGPQFDRRGMTDKMRSGPGWLPTRHFRQPSAGSVDHRHSRLGDVFPSAVRPFDFTGEEARSFLPDRPRARRRCRSTSLRDRLARAGDDHGRVRAPHGSCRIAAALELRISAVAPHAGAAAKKFCAEAEDVPREEAAVRRDDLSRHGLLPVRLEHGQRRVQVQPASVSPDPKAIIDQLHEDHFKSSARAYPTGIRGNEGHGADACDPARRAETQPSVLLGHASAGARDRRGRLVAR